MQDVPTRLLLTIEEAAEELRMSAGYVKQLIRDGRLSRLKLGTRTRIERTALESWIAANRTVPDFVTTPRDQVQTWEEVTREEMIDFITGGHR